MPDAESVARRKLAHVEMEPENQPLGTTGGFSVDPTNRHQARAFYSSVFNASAGIAMGWSGDTASCVAGTNAMEYRDAVLRRVNWFRAMAGVPSTVSFSAVRNSKCQQAAQMMSANTALSHYPPPSWVCYTAEGSEAAQNSNISWGNDGWDAVYSQMRDNSGSNTNAGHRRWILYPHTVEMGSGDVPAQGDKNRANALWVIDAEHWGVRPATRDYFVAWPPPGHVPYPVVFPRWSFAYPDADFSGARVGMSCTGQPVAVEIESVAGMSGESAIIWAADGLNADASLTAWPRPVTDTVYTVWVSNVVIGGVSSNFTYQVTVIDPAVVGPDEPSLVVTGETRPAAGSTNIYLFSGPGFAVSHELQTSELVEYAYVEGAETGLTWVTVSGSTGLYAVVASSVFHSGGHSFHLAHPDSKSQLLTMMRPLLVHTNSELRFWSRLGWATTNQIARVSLSGDEGVTWSDVYVQRGTQSSGESDFVQRVVGLGAYAGKVVWVRFAYEVAGEYYVGTADDLGWLLDDIQVVGVMEQGSVVTADLGTNTSFVVVPDRVGVVLGARIRPVGWAGLPGLDWGPLLELAVVDPATVDRDRDGLPDVWEAANGLAAVDGAGRNGASGDPDGDGFVNLAEYVAGTSPTNSNSVLMIRSMESGVGNRGAGFTFSSVSGRTYSVEWHTSLVAGTMWTILSNEFVSVAGPVVVVDTNAAAGRFYRVRVR